MKVSRRPGWSFATLDRVYIRLRYFFVRSPQGFARKAVPGRIWSWSGKDIPSTSNRLGRARHTRHNSPGSKISSSLMIEATKNSINLSLAFSLEITQGSPLYNITMTFGTLPFLSTYPIPDYYSWHLVSPRPLFLSHVTQNIPTKILRHGKQMRLA